MAESATTMMLTWADYENTNPTLVVMPASSGEVGRHTDWQGANTAFQWSLREYLFQVFFSLFQLT